MSRRRLWKLWHLALRYWFDAVILGGVVGGVIPAIVLQHTKNGPDGPLWFHILAVIGFTTPLLLRRRFPLKAPLAIYVVIATVATMSNQSGPRGPSFVW